MRHCLLVFFFLMLISTVRALVPDATREQVIAELGKPTAVAKLGTREILIYPKGVQLELEEGKVVATQGIALSDTVPAPVPPTIAAPPQDTEKTRALAEKQAKKIAAENDAAEHEFDPEAAKGQPSIQKALEGMERSHEEEQRPRPPKKFDIAGFFLGTILKFILTVAALKLACKYWGAEVFWNVIFIVAGVDAVVSGMMNLIGELVLGFPTLFSADDLVGGILMLFLLKKLSVNHAIGQAIQLTLTTKTFIVVVGSFLVTMALRLLH